jgi:prepilin-type N-terminal cleavage/methylation domain-containing protein
MVCVLSSHRSDTGLSLVELLLVVAIVGVLAAIAIPMSGNSLRYLKLSGDARDLSNATSLAKMRAAAKFSRSRLFVDLPGKTYYVQTYVADAAAAATAPAGCNTATLPVWCTETGTSASLSSTVSFSYGPVSAPPLDTQTTIHQATACQDASSNPIANTACVMFNSRGLPVDPTASFGPTGNEGLYVADGTAVYGITVSATGFIRLWRNNYQSIAAWSVQ